MGIIITIVIGLIIGVVAKLIMPGRDPGGIIVTILLGIAGSFVGTWLADRNTEWHLCKHADVCRACDTHQRRACRRRQTDTGFPQSTYLRRWQYDWHRHS